ncbi:rCG49006 [Rattus norvegicus]|uniref:RCG49006 n=1 Tax=Rattus norvegicus TaxID=10116 RepID=A6IG14_RAT|nr:rCG49006 [Rattus norvegicus]
MWSMVLHRCSASALCAIVYAPPLGYKLVPKWWPIIGAQ